MDKLIAAKSEPLWNTNNKVVSIIGGLVVLLFALPLVGLNSFYLHLFIMIFMHAVMAQSWNVIAGFSGQISLGHGAFFGIGAYATSFFYMEYGITPWISIFFGMLISNILLVRVCMDVHRKCNFRFSYKLTLGVRFSEAARKMTQNEGRVVELRGKGDELQRLGGVAQPELGNAHEMLDLGHVLVGRGHLRLVRRLARLDRHLLARAVRKGCN